MTADNLNKLAVVADIPTAGTPTGDALRAAYGRVVTGPTLPTVPTGEYVWMKTDGSGNLLDILSGTA